LRYAAYNVDDVGAIVMSSFRLRKLLIPLLNHLLGENSC